MSKVSKLGLGVGLVVGVLLGLFAYRSYQKNEDDLRRDMIDDVRSAYADEEIDVVWLLDEPIATHLFRGGLCLTSGQVIDFEIDENRRDIRVLSGSEVAA